MTALSPRTRRALSLTLAATGMTYRDALAAAASHDGVMRQQYIRLAAHKCQRSSGSWSARVTRVHKDLAILAKGGTS